MKNITNITKWLKTTVDPNEKISYECSNCRFIAKLEGTPIQNNYKYCPCCGCHMYTMERKQPENLRSITYEKG